MTEVLLKVLHLIPNYLIDLSRVLSKPKTFVAQRNRRPDETFTGSLVFLGISLIIVVLIQGFLPPKTDLWNDLLKEMFRHGLPTALLPAALTWAWRLVRGKATFKSIFVTYCYFAGAALVIVNVAGMVLIGAIVTLFPDAAKGTLPESGKPVVLILIALLGFAVIAWFIVFWGAFRQLNDLSRVHSFVAFLVFLLLALPVILITEYFRTAISLSGP